MSSQESKRRAFTKQSCHLIGGHKDDTKFRSHFVAYAVVQSSFNVPDNFHHATWVSVHYFEALILLL